MEQPYRPAHKLVGWAVGLLIASIVLDVALAGIELIIGFYYPDYYNYNTPVQPGEEIVTLAMIGTALLMMLNLIATAIAFCMWVFRASKNARALGAQRMRFSAGWAVGYFFIPIINLFRPYQAIKEIELASSPDHGSRDWRQGAPSGRVGVWWAFWIIASVLSNISSQMGSSMDPQTAHASSWVGFSASLFSICAAVTAIRVVKHIHYLQETKVRLQPDAGQRTCLQCEYDLRATPGTHCPECGAPIPGRDDFNLELEAPDPSEPYEHWENR